MNLANRVATRAGAYLKTRAERLAKFLFTGGKLRFVTKRQIMDGFLVEGKRAGNVGSYTVLDMPAYLVLLSHYFDANIPFNSARAPVALLPLGRDSYYEDGITEVIDLPSDSLTLAPISLVHNFGDVSGLANSYFARTGIMGREAPGNGAAYAYTAIWPAVVYPPGFTNPLFDGDEGYADRNTRCVYCINIVAPTFYRQIASAPDWQITRVPETPTSEHTMLSLRISDSVFGGFGGGMGFAKKTQVYLPGTGPDGGENDASAWTAASRPWVSFAKPYYRDEDDGTQTFVITVWAVVVLDMNTDADYLGVKGVWISDIEITAAGAQIARTTVFDPRPTNLYPIVVDASEDGSKKTHTANYHLRCDGARFKSGTLLVIDPYYVQPTTDANATTLAMYLRYFGKSGAGTLELYRETDLGSTPSGGRVAPVGCDVNEAGDTVYIMIFSGTELYQPTSADLNVYAATEAGATLVFSAHVPLISCWGGVGEQYYSVGQGNVTNGEYVTGNIAWTNNDGFDVAAGAGGNHVRYIGNNQYAFVCSTVGASGPGLTLGGDIAVGIYNSLTNTVALAGIVVPAETYGNGNKFYPIGAIECTRLATQDTPATLIVTRGPNGQENGRFNPALPPTLGTTYISYDSGATWLKILNAGSMAGAFHAGNALAPRSEPVVKG